MEVRSAPGERGFLLHLAVRGDPAGDLLLVTTAAIRPPDGALLPVVKGQVSARADSTVLLLGEESETVVMAVLLRIRWRP